MQHVSLTGARLGPCTLLGLGAGAHAPVVGLERGVPAMANASGHPALRLWHLLQRMVPAHKKKKALLRLEAR